MVLLNFNWYKIFYWLTVADNAKGFFITSIVIFSIIVLCSASTFAFGRRESDWSITKIGIAGKKIFFWSLPFLLFFWSLQVFTPNKKDALLIIAGGGTMEFLTTDSTAKKIPAEMSNFVLMELKNMAKDAKVELGIATQKDRILDEAKEMTADQLIQRMQTDTNFAKILLKNK